MRVFRKSILFLIVAFAMSVSFSITAQAAPASEAEFEVKQPSGQTFKVRQQGDEFVNYLVTQTGYIVEEKADGYWYYTSIREFMSGEKEAAEIVATGQRYLLDTVPGNAMKQADVTKYPALDYKREVLAPQTFELPKARTAVDASLGLSRDQNLLVILVSFNDVAIQKTEADWNTRVFGTANNSLKQYYKEATADKINILPAKETFGTSNNGVVSVKLNRNHPRTTIKDSTGVNQSITKDALIAADSMVDFSQYDKNGNGKIEADELHIMTIVAGQEASYNSGSGSQLVTWGHKHALPATITPTLDGKVFGDFTQFGEMQGANQATIGIIAHEFGHDLGLPDLYNTAGIGGGLGYYSVMASGSWGRMDYELLGARPLHFDAYSKMKLGVVTPTTIAVTGTHSMDVFSLDQAGRNVVRVNTANPKEYYLIENRQFSGFDSALATYAKSGGVAIYHVNEKYDKNTEIGKQLVTLKEANEGIIGSSQLNAKIQSNLDGLYYIGTGGTNVAQQTVLNKTTRPAAVRSDGEAANFAVKVNSASNAKMNITLSNQGLEVAVNKTETGVEKGESTQLSVNFMPENTPNKAVTWSSSNTAVATVDATGKVTAKNVAGTANITVTSTATGAKSTCVLTVDDHGRTFETATTISDNGKTSGLISYDYDEDYFKFVPTQTGSYEMWTEGETYTGLSGYLYNGSKGLLDYNHRGFPEDGTNYHFKLKYDLVAGQTYYLRTKLYNEGTSEYTLNMKVPGVTSSISVTGVTLDKATSQLEKTGATQLTATVLPANATNKAVTWTSSNTAVASVDSNGKITAGNTAGTTGITAKTTDGAKTASHVVTVDDHGGVFATATTITDSSLTHGQILFANDLDYFKFVPTKTGAYTITSEGTTDMVGALYSNAQAQLATDDDSNGNRQFKMTQTLTAGTTYYIQTRAYSSNTGAYQLRITPPGIGVESVSLNTATSSIEKTGTTQLTATVLPADALNKAVTWTTSNSSVATVDTTGKITAGNTAGTATITAKTTDGAKTATHVVTVDDHGGTFATATTVTDSSLTDGQILFTNDLDYFKFVPTKTGVYTIVSEGTIDVKGYLYSSTQEQLAYNDDGNGSSQFKLTYDLTAGQTYYVQARHYSTGTGAYKLRITQPAIGVESVSLNTATSSIEKTGTTQLTATVLPADALNKAVTWTTSNSSVATVDTTGKITAGNTAGTATITAKTTDGAKTATHVVTVDDHGGTFATATTVTDSSLTDGQILFTNDLDYFKFVPTKTGVYTIVSEGTVDVKGYLYSSMQEQLAYNDDGNGNAQFKLTYNLTAGQTYYVQARHYGTGTGAYKLRITQPAIGVESVSLNIAASSIEKTGTTQLTATVLPADALNKAVTWTTSNSSVATVDTTGKITAGNTPGTATITAKTTDGAKTATHVVTVDDHGGTFATATTVANNSLTNGQILFANDLDYFKFVPTKTASYAITSEGTIDMKGVLYSSTESQLTSNDDGNGNYQFRMTYTLTAGETYYILARHYSSSTGAYQLRIAETTIPVTGVTLDATTSQLALNETKQLTATIAPSNATNKNVTWSSSNTAVATVDTAGKITSKSAGTATITATSTDGSKQATHTVTITDIKPTQVQIQAKDTNKYVVNGIPKKLAATVLPAGVSQNITWTSSNASAVTVATDGTLTYKGQGKATITATSTVNTLMKDTLEVIADDYSGLYNESPFYEFGKNITGRIDYGEDDYFQGYWNNDLSDQEMLKFKAPETGTYKMHLFATDASGSRSSFIRFKHWRENNQVWTDSTALTFPTVTLQKDEIMYVQITATGLVDFWGEGYLNVTSTGAKWNFKVDKAENMGTGTQTMYADNKLITGDTLAVNATTKSLTLSSKFDRTDHGIRPTYWTSSNTAIATVDRYSGKVTILGKGKVNITVENEYLGFGMNTFSSKRVTLDIQ
ncbi:M6 family metalloprotease domain-containing protein [Listeria weihenstephanensis]|uniref:M6 family metalloprotease domain-containing protein n=1 Tax=Listeria weihenstephanensis TaxID=1006155 RepID=A0A841Z7Z7_9LIST|nr:Ig-like domain-containing protein [Listeria weihenstephanensis]MBC1501340.1 M6 family metalloprotease domain-containing protein [Listeria weihenstephanensis]